MVVVVIIVIVIIIIVIIIVIAIGICIATMLKHTPIPLSRESSNTPISK